MGRTTPLRFFERNTTGRFSTRGKGRCAVFREREDGHELLATLELGTRRSLRLLSWARTARRLAVVVAGRRELEVLLVDLGQPPRSVFSLARGDTEVHEAVISPDGRWLALVIEVTSDPGAVLILRLPEAGSGEAACEAATIEAPVDEPAALHWQGPRLVLCDAVHLRLAEARAGGWWPYPEVPAEAWRVLDVEAGAEASDGLAHGAAQAAVPTGGDELALRRQWTRKVGMTLTVVGDDGRRVFLKLGPARQHLVAIDVASGREVWRLDVNTRLGLRLGWRATVVGEDVSIEQDVVLALARGSDGALRPPSATSKARAAAAGTMPWAVPSTTLALPGIEVTFDGDYRGRTAAGEEWLRRTDEAPEVASSDSCSWSVTSGSLLVAAGEDAFWSVESRSDRDRWRLVARSRRDGEVVRVIDERTEPRRAYPQLVGAAAGAVLVWAAGQLHAYGR